MCRCELNGGELPGCDAHGFAWSARPYAALLTRSDYNMTATPFLGEATSESILRKTERLWTRLPDSPNQSLNGHIRSVLLKQDSSWNRSAVVRSNLRRPPFAVRISLDNEEAQPSWHDRGLLVGCVDYGCQKFEVGIG